MCIVLPESEYIANMILTNLPPLSTSAAEASTDMRDGAMTGVTDA
jgi:hypothetical protein